MATKTAAGKRAQRPAASGRGAPRASSAAAAPATAAPRPVIFLSYRHAVPTTEIANRLYTALVAPAEYWGADVFMDDSAIEPSDLFDQRIMDALDRTTHFIVLLTNAYWASPYCRKELARAVERFEQGRQLRLLFVLVEDLEPRYFTFAADRVSGRIASDDPVVERIGDVQFLGPFDAGRRLVRLRWDDDAALSDQLAQLVQRLGRVI